MTTQPFDGNPPVFGALGRLYQSVYGTAQNLISHALLALFARLAIAGVFWRSFLNKVETNGLFDYVEVINNFEVQRSLMKVPAFPITIEDSTFAQFGEGGMFELPLIPGGVAAVMATAGEGILPILLVLGLLTRFAATGLIVMALVIQIFVFPTNAHFWGSIALWFVPLFYLVGRGSGPISVDHLLSRQLAR
ncbi:DoxX family membrane protein [Hyphobacterium sp.]|jgi:putative oxidoreductase|uniref:DoxX family membrane protein n=1 Tax=Hyphobacterium sp. TaxID=2004662 RepID=UPI003BA9C1BF